MKIIILIGIALSLCGCTTTSKKLISTSNGTTYYARLNKCSRCGNFPNSHLIEVRNMTYLKCSKCSNGTMSFKNPSEAVDNWNNNN